MTRSSSWSGWPLRHVHHSNDNVARRVSYKKQELLTIRGFTYGFGGVRVAHPFVSCVVLCFLCLFPVTSVSGVASISGLSILDCAFGFLKRLCRIIVPLWKKNLNGDGQQFPRYQLSLKSLNAKLTQYMVLGSEVITWHGGKCGRVKPVYRIPARDSWIYNDNQININLYIFTSKRTNISLPEYKKYYRNFETEKKFNFLRNNAFCGFSTLLSNIDNCIQAW